MARLGVSTVTLDAPDPPALARFYSDLLGWPLGEITDSTWVPVRDPSGGVGIAVQLEPSHVPPHWPARADAQQMQVHLEIRCDDLDAAVAHAVRCGAQLAQFQPQQDVRVCLDPAGHPFCLWTEPAPTTSSFPS